MANKHKAGLRAPKGHAASAAYVGKCPHCRRRVELKAMSVGLTVTKRFCTCYLRPKDYKSIAERAGRV